MQILENIIVGVVGAISATVIVSLFAALWRRRVVNKYKLSQQAKEILAALWDEELIRVSSMIAHELDIPEDVVDNELKYLKRNGLARIRKQNKEGKDPWKITWKGQEYLSQISWLGDLI